MSWRPFFALGSGLAIPATLNLKVLKNLQAGMRRSWVLADGERKRLTALKSASNKFMTSSEVGQDCPSMDMSDSRLMMDKEESEQIQDLLDKMTMIRNQTEDMNPEVGIMVVCLIR